MRFLPTVYDWTMRHKITRLYGELRLLEEDLETPGRKDIAAATAKLDHLESQANRLKMPVAYANQVFNLRHHIDIVRASLKRHADRAAGLQSPPAAPTKSESSVAAMSS